MMQASLSDFAFIGPRDYVHGPTFFEAFRARVAALAGLPPAADFLVRLLRINQTVHANGTIAVGDAAEADAGWGKPDAEMSSVAGGRSWQAAFYGARGTTPIVRRVAPREKELVRDVSLSAPFCGSARLEGMRDAAELFQAAVEANKQIHLKTLVGDPLSTAVRFKFAYCTDYRCLPLPAGGSAEVSIRGAGLRASGEYRCSLTSLELRLGGLSTSFRLCFATKDRRTPNE